MVSSTSSHDGGSYDRHSRRDLLDRSSSFANLSRSELRRASLNTTKTSKGEIYHVPKCTSARQKRLEARGMAVPVEEVRRRKKPKPMLITPARRMSLGRESLETPTSACPHTTTSKHSIVRRVSISASTCSSSIVKPLIRGEGDGAPENNHHEECGSVRARRAPRRSSIGTSAESGLRRMPRRSSMGGSARHLRRSSMGGSTRHLRRGSISGGSSRRLQRDDVTGQSSRQLCDPVDVVPTESSSSKICQSKTEDPEENSSTFAESVSMGDTDGDDYPAYQEDTPGYGYGDNDCAAYDENTDYGYGDDDYAAYDDNPDYGYGDIVPDSERAARGDQDDYGCRKAYQRVNYDTKAIFYVDDDDDDPEIVVLQESTPSEYEEAAPPVVPKPTEERRRTTQIPRRKSFSCRL